MSMKIVEYIVDKHYIEIEEIVVYSRSIINAYSLLSHEWWVPLINFIVRLIIHVRGGSMHLWYSGST